MRERLDIDVYVNGRATEASERSVKEADGLIESGVVDIGVGSEEEDLMDDVDDNDAEDEFDRFVLNPGPMGRRILHEGDFEVGIRLMSTL